LCSTPFADIDGTAQAPRQLYPRPALATRKGAIPSPKKPADKEGCADTVLPLCRTETMTGETIVIGSRPYFQ